MLNRSEQRRLRAIERSLEQDDPEMVQRLRTADWKRPPNRVSHLTVVSVFGLVLALFGVLLGTPAVILLGLIFAVAGFWLRLMLSWSAGPVEDNGTREPDGPR